MSDATLERDGTGSGSTDRRSWVQVLIDAIDGLPGPSWAAYLVLAACSIVLTTSQVWVSGLVPYGTFPVAQVFYGALPVAILWVLGTLDGVAVSALGSYRSVMDVDDRQLEAIRRDLVEVRARPAALLIVVGLGFVVGQYALDPSGSRIRDLSWLGLIIRGAVEWAMVALFLVLAYHTIHQLGAVQRIHRLPARIDLLRPTPLYAFSRLTMSTAVALIVLVSSFIIGDPPAVAAASPAVLAVWAAIGLALPAVAFVVPLRGMHTSIAAEKDRMGSVVADRLETVLELLHEDVDNGDLGNADARSKVISSLMVERDMVSRLPTWPWQPSTVGTLVTAMVLPLVLWLLTRVLERVI